MHIVDSHLHYWQPSLPDRPHDRTGLYIAEPLSAEEVLDEVTKAGVSRIAQITPSIVGYDNRYSFEMAEKYPDRIIGVFGRFDPEPPEMGRRLAEFIAHPRAIG